MSDYLLVLPIDRYSIGDTYQIGESIPLHCTVMHWFPQRSHLALEAFKMWLQGLTKDTEPVWLISEHAALFGPDENVPVHTLVRNPALNLLHTRIFRFLVTTRCEPNELGWIGAGYRPHVTTVGDRVFLPGEKHLADSIALVERETNRQKRVIAKYSFKV